MLIAIYRQKTAFDIVYFMTQLDGHQTDFTLLLRGNFVWCWLFIHNLFCFHLLFMFLSRFSTIDVAMSRRWDFFYQHVAVYLRCSLWSNLFKNLTAIPFFMRIYVIDPITIDHVRHSLAKRHSCAGEIYHYSGCNYCHLHNNQHLNDPLTQKRNKNINYKCTYFFHVKKDRSVLLQAQVIVV